MAERFNRSIRYLPKRLVFERDDADCFHVLPTRKKKYKNRKPSSAELTPIESSLKKDGGYVYQNLKDEWKKVITKNETGDLDRTADLKKTFSKTDTTNWSYKLYKNKKIVLDTIPSYRTGEERTSCCSANILPERYNEPSMKTTKTLMEENKDVMKALNLK